jgi:hypothetical protein
LRVGRVVVGQGKRGSFSGEINSLRKRTCDDVHSVTITSGVMEAEKKGKGMWLVEGLRRSNKVKREEMENGVNEEPEVWKEEY